MFSIEENGVYQTETLESGAVIKKFYDMLLHTELSYDAVSQTVIATIYDYQNVQQSTYANQITFDYDGQQITVPATNGQAGITFTSTVAGDHVIRTVNADMRNGEVTLHVV